VIALYLDDSLDSDQWTEVEIGIGEGIDPRRIPWLIPVAVGSNPHPKAEPNVVLPHLLRLGLERFRGKRVALVAPRDLRWCASLSEAIRNLTGAYPLLVQTPRHRDSVGIPGPLRIIDMEAYVLDGDATTPPWLQP